MPLQPEPKMHVHREVSQVRSQRKTSVASSGLANSTKARGKSTLTSGIASTIVATAKTRYVLRSGTMGGMRIGVLDIGSNTGHLLIVDAYRGGAPVPAHTYKESLRLSEQLDANGAMGQDGIDRLLKYVAEAKSEAEENGCTTVLAFATSAVRDATNAEELIEFVRTTSGVNLQVLPGEDEARLTFLAVRRWFGWSSGRLGVFDIGGG